MTDRLPPIIRFTPNTTNAPADPHPPPNVEKPRRKGKRALAGQPGVAVVVPAAVYPFVIAIDTREQRPWDFPCQTIRKTLRSGDYALVGYEDRCAVERKHPDELYTNFGSARDRFRREWERLAAMEYAAVVIEGTLADILTPHFRSTVSPKTVINSLLSWSVRHRVTVWFAQDREHAQALTFRLLQKYHEHAIRQLAAPAIPLP